MCDGEHVHVNSSSSVTDNTYEACFSPRRCAIIHVCMQGLVASSRISLHPPLRLLDDSSSVGHRADAHAKQEDDKEGVAVHGDAAPGGTGDKATWHDLVCGGSGTHVQRNTLIPALPRLGPECAHKAGHVLLCSAENRSTEECKARALDHWKCIAAQTAAQPTSTTVNIFLF
jgi:hypothetical protein